MQLRSLTTGIFAAFGMLFAADAAAQVPATDTLTSLHSCLSYALEHNPSSTVYQNQAKIARQKALETSSVYLPQINAAAQTDDNVKRPTTIIPGGVFSPNDLEVQMGSQYSTNAYVQLEQTVYDQSMFYAGPANKANTAIAQLNILRNNEEIVYTTSTAYYQVLIYSEQEKLLAQNEKKYNDLLAVLQLQYQKGAAKKLDYDRVRVNLNNIKAQQALVAMNKELALNRLKNAMGLALESNLMITDSLDYNREVAMPVRNVGFDFHQLVDHRIQEQNVRLLDLNVRRRRAAYFPTLSFYARYGAQSYGNEFGASFNNWFDYSAIGLKLNVPIFSGFRRNSVYMQSKLEFENAKLNMEISEQNMRLRYLNSWTQLFSSYTSLTMNHENLDLAQEVFETTSLQYQSGAVPLSDFLNSDYSYKEAQTNYITSLLNFLTARLDYERAQGTLTIYINNL
jgi:outer membrane protein TolC